MTKENAQLLLEQELAKLGRSGRIPRLFLHACCAPCASYVLEYLSRYFEITVFYFNPNISPDAEYRKRVNEMKRLIREIPQTHPITMSEGIYEPNRFYEAVRGLEQESEGGRRCEVCFRLRLFETAKQAARDGYDFFTTTLTISPLKNAALLNQIGREAGERFGIRFLPSDFKKRGGYQRSIELSREYNLYRQNFCGCIYSKSEMENKKEAKE